MAKKYDRFGWDRDRGSVAHDRLLIDWMDALQDYPLDEIKAACRAHVIASPRTMPNEGDIVGQIKSARKARIAGRLKPATIDPDRRRVSSAEAIAILAAAGFRP